MKWVGRILLGLVVLVAVGVGVIYATGNGFWLKIAYAMVFASPELPFDPDDAVAPPDYADPSNWAALPAYTDYTIRVRSTGTGGWYRLGYIHNPRLVVVQSDGTKITDTETQIEIGDDANTTSDSYSELSDKKVYYYDSSKFDPEPTAYFEAVLKNTDQPRIEQQINIMDKQHTAYDDDPILYCDIIIFVFSILVFIDQRHILADTHILVKDDIPHLTVLGDPYTNILLGDQFKEIRPHEVDTIHSHSISNDTPNSDD